MPSIRRALSFTPAPPHTAPAAPPQAERFEDAITRIKRDIIFAASLYL